jgi:hypothetical protein
MKEARWHRQTISSTQMVRWSMIQEVAHAVHSVGETRQVSADDTVRRTDGGSGRRRRAVGGSAMLAG